MADNAAETKNEVSPQKEEVEKDVPDVGTDEDSKTSENGDAKVKENGSSNDDAKEDTENGDSTDTPDVCTIKRKSAGGDAPDGTPAEGVSPEKKAKLEEKPAEVESNGEAEAAA